MISTEAFHKPCLPPPPQIPLTILTIYTSWLWLAQKPFISPASPLPPNFSYNSYNLYILVNLRFLQSFGHIKFLLQFLQPDIPLTILTIGPSPLSDSSYNSYNYSATAVAPDIPLTILTIGPPPSDSFYNSYNHFATWYSSYNSYKGSYSPELFPLQFLQ